MRTRLSGTSWLQRLLPKSAAPCNIWIVYIYIYYRLIEIFSSMLIIIIIITIHVEIVQTIYTICEILIYKFEIHIEQFTSGKCDRLMPIYIYIYR